MTHLNTIFGDIRARCHDTPTLDNTLTIQTNIVQVTDVHGEQAATTLMPYLLQVFSSWPDDVLFPSQAHAQCQTLCAQSIDFLLCVHRCLKRKWFEVDQYVLEYITRLMTFLMNEYQFMHGRSTYDVPDAITTIDGIIDAYDLLYREYCDHLIDNHYGLLGYVVRLSSYIGLHHTILTNQPLHDLEVCRSSQAWSELTAFFEEYVLRRPLRHTDGLFPGELTYLQHQLHAPLPKYVREYHQYFGRIELGCDHIIPLCVIRNQPSKLPGVETIIENQGCVTWVFSAHDREDDPLMYQVQERYEPHGTHPDQFKDSKYVAELSTADFVSTHTGLTFSKLVVSLALYPHVTRTTHSRDDMIQGDDLIPF